MPVLLNSSRTKNIKRNAISGIFKQLSGILLSFLVRTAVIYFLGAEYQGLNGLFTAILQVLNMTDLGFSAAVIYVLFKPISEDDVDTVCNILNYLKKIYKIIGLVILVSGLCLLPFLTKLINGTYPDDINIYVLFLIYLGNTVVSYFLFAYKSTALTALQRDDIVSNVYTFTSISIRIVQIILLFLFHNYYFYALLLPICSILNNIIIEILSRKKFPDIRLKGTISKDLKKEINKQVKSVFLSRLADVSRNCFDSIAISLFLGLTFVTVYDNYFYIFTALSGMMSVFIHAAKASIGNSIAKETVDKNYGDYNVFTFLFMLLGGFCTICLYCLYQPFMTIWMRGDDGLLLLEKDMILYCVYFYIYCMTYTKCAYLEARGLFHECRYLYVFEALLNFVLNMVLGYFFGITGILIATIFTLFVFNFLGGTIILNQHYFHKRLLKIFLLHCIMIIVTILVSIAARYISNLIPVSGILGFVIKTIICSLVACILLLVIYFKTPMFSSSMKIIKRFLKTKLK